MSELPPPPEPPWPASEPLSATERCPACGWPLRLAWVHGHGQCERCGQNVEPCCQGSPPPVELDPTSEPNPPPPGAKRSGDTESR